MSLDSEAEAIDDWLHDPRSREERQLAHLREWLARPSWNEWQAKMVLSGLAPNESAIFRGEPLPGMKWEGISEDEVRQQYSDLMEDAGQFVGGSPRPPSDWLKLAFRNGFRPEWLAAAVADDTCKGFLPTEAPGVVGKRDKMKESQIRKGMARKKSDPTWSTIETVGHPLFLAWWKLDPEHRPTKEKLAEDIRNEVLESSNLPSHAPRDADQASPRTIKDHIRQWVLREIAEPLFNEWRGRTSRCTLEELAEQVMVAFERQLRDKRERPRLGTIAHALEQWRAEA